jgi:ATP-dependent DNA helicase DinG
VSLLFLCCFLKHAFVICSKKDRAMNLSDIETHTPSSTAWAHDAMKHFDQVLCQASGWAPRAGQRQMAELVASTFANAQLGLADEADVDLVNETATPPQRHMAVIQAGTGVGKSLGYSIAAISVALARQTRVVISTATVALQEQLIQKDLPLLAAQWDKPFEFALAKGRGRYVCQLKLERWVGNDDAATESDDELFGDVGSPHDAEPLPHKARIEWYRTLHQALGTNSWNGDKDELPTTPDGGAWGAIAAESSSCTGKHCPLFSRCGYFVQRKNLVNAS